MNRQLLNPKSIVVVGGTDNLSSPGGKVLKNILDGGFSGELSAVNPKKSEVQGVRCFPDAAKLPPVELAIFAIPARFIKDAVETLARDKGTKAFIILSAGFSETAPEGKELEREISAIIEHHGGVLIGPNCIGILTPHYQGVFAGPIPKFDPFGCDFASGSGATAAFIMEKGVSLGLSFSTMYSVGNSAQIGVEEIVKYWDETFNPDKSSRIKLLYMENIGKPDMLIRHASSLIRKGCRIAAVKAGSTKAGGRAASSHTGALASSDAAVDALFRKAGIARCHGREDLVLTAAIFTHPPVKGKNMVVITHAGGPGVMLTDTLTRGGVKLPKIESSAAAELRARLAPGSSVNNPIDFLATGTAEQLRFIIDTIESRMPSIDAMAVVFGDAGLFDVVPVFQVILDKMKECRLPIFPIFPSVVTGRSSIDFFKAQGRVYFDDEVSFGRALTNIANIPSPIKEGPVIAIDEHRIKKTIEQAGSGFLPPAEVAELLDGAGICRAPQALVKTKEEALSWAQSEGFPVVMKVVGVLHKSEYGGVIVDISDENALEEGFGRLMRIKGATAVLMQPMLSGKELFVGAKREKPFGHMILCGLGGIFVEVLKDVSCALAPVGFDEALSMIRSLKSYKIIKGIRGQEGVDEEEFAKVIVRISRLVQTTPDIKELDLNPLLAHRGRVVTVDARIKLS